MFSGTGYINGRGLKRFCDKTQIYIHNGFPIAYSQYVSGFPLFPHSYFKQGPLAYK